MDEVNRYTCFCRNGFDGYDCEENILPCDTDEDDCDQNAHCYHYANVTCPLGRDSCNILTEGVTHYCQCFPGYTTVEGYVAGTNCSEVDECAVQPCHNGATCNNHIFNYTCDCAPGFRGRDCDHDLDECLSTPCGTHGGHGGFCSDSNIDDSVPADSYVCVCPPGWDGENCDVDINECDSSPCQN
eukprot:SAG31_NODE_19835_length_590_cov_1.321792_1_plen_184_part_10